MHQGRDHRDDLGVPRLTARGWIAEDIPAIQGRPNAPVSGTDEDTIYNLTAFVMLVKLSTDDCDIHMEVADTGNPSAPRIIVEVPAKQAGVQNLVAKLLNLKKIPDVQVLYHVRRTAWKLTSNVERSRRGTHKPSGTRRA